MLKTKPVEKSQEEIFDNFFSPSSDEEDQVKIIAENDSFTPELALIN